MSAYKMAVYALLLALLIQSYAALLSLDILLRQPLANGKKQIWFALAIVSALFAFQQGYWLELALRTGLHETTQALLSLITSGLFCFVVSRLKQQAETPPPP